MLKNEVLEHLAVRLAAKEHPPITEGVAQNPNFCFQMNKEFDIMLLIVYFGELKVH